MFCLVFNDGLFGSVRDSGVGMLSCEWNLSMRLLLFDRIDGEPTYDV